MSEAERRAGALLLLEGAYRLLAGGLRDVIEALQSSWVDEEKSALYSWHARRQLQRLAGDMNLSRWGNATGRTQEDVLQLVRRAISSLGGVPPPLPAPPHVARTGGWRVS